MEPSLLIPCGMWDLFLDSALNKIFRGIFRYGKKNFFLEHLVEVFKIKFEFQGIKKNIKHKFY